ncbi:MAG TPA: fumarylacetoacetate hydrolase family protein [Alphaproteobacteria bacterium]|jgi:fumarylpyruvate hydrolase
MTDFLFAAPTQPGLPVLGSAALFPVRTIYAFTGTYGQGRPEPSVFTKATHTLAPNGAAVPMPSQTAMFEPEIELVVAIGKAARALDTAKAARDAVLGYAVGLDLTRRDLQRAARNAGLPWDMAKTFEAASPIGTIHQAADIGHPERGAITLDVNGARAQEGDLEEMSWLPLNLVALLSKYVTLQPGDLIFTGTPTGTANLQPGDTLLGCIEGLTDLRVSITAPTA